MRERAARQSDMEVGGVDDVNGVLMEISSRLSLGDTAGLGELYDTLPEDMKEDFKREVLGGRLDVDGGVELTGGEEGVWVPYWERGENKDTTDTEGRKFEDLTEAIISCSPFVSLLPSKFRSRLELNSGDYPDLYNNLLDILLAYSVTCRVFNTEVGGGGIGGGRRVRKDQSSFFRRLSGVLGSDIRHPPGLSSAYVISKFFERATGSSVGWNKDDGRLAVSDAFCILGSRRYCQRAVWGVGGMLGRGGGDEGEVLL